MCYFSLNLAANRNPNQDRSMVSTMAVSQEDYLTSQVHPPPSVSHSLHATNQSFTPHDLHHLVLIHFVKHAGAEDFPHLCCSVANMTICLLRKRSSKRRNERRCCGVQLAELHVRKLGVQHTIKEPVSVIGLIRRLDLRVLTQQPIVLYRHSPFPLVTSPRRTRRHVSTASLRAPIQSRIAPLHRLLQKPHVQVLVRGLAGS